MEAIENKYTCSSFPKVEFVTIVTKMVIFGGYKYTRSP